jgi:hypothetical protein
MTVEDRIDDEKRAEGLASDANTMVEKTDEAEKSDNDAEKTDVEAENDPGDAIVPEDTLSPDDYPKGLQFVFILLALVLSIFMVALDLVCLSPVFRQIYTDPACRLLSQRPSQRSRISFTAFPR